MSDTKDHGSSEPLQPITPVGSHGLAPPTKEPFFADFKKWARRDAWHIAEGAALILGFEPFDVRDHSWPPMCRLPPFADIYETASRSHSIGSRVHPRRFLAWAREKDYPIPAELEEAVNRFHSTGDGRSQAGAAGPKWPWGSHETGRLRHLAAAAYRFWRNYDPSDPTTAPTNQQVIDWLVEQGVTPRTAESIARILRADGLPTGPRK